MSDTIDLINAIQNGESIAIEDNFNSIMAAKISDRIDSLRSEIASTMFSNPEEVETAGTESGEEEQE